MRIRGWHIEGFGIHRDWRVDGLSDGLNVFTGPNEAGKSTLLAFLRGALFGYPDGRSSEPKYEPKDGAPHGGRVMLRGDAGDWVVERYAGRGRKLSVTLEDGRAGDEAELAERLGHADARLFKSVFAFGLRELQELGSLGEAGVQDHLFAAGVTGGGRSAREAARELREAARERFDGPRGRKKTDRARVLVREIAALNEELYLRQEAAERYPELRDRERTLEANLRGLDAEAETLRAAERRARKLVELWNEVQSPLADAREQAAKLAPALPESLPGDAAPRLEGLLQRLARAEERREELRCERAAVAAQLEALRLDEPARRVAARVDALRGRLALHRSQQQRLAELDSRAAACAAQVASALDSLFGADRAADGRSADPPRLRAVQCTPLRREQLRDWKRRLDEASAAVRDGEAAERLLAGQLEAARGRASELRARLGQLPEVDRDRLEDRQQALRALRTLAPRLREAEKEQDARADALARHESAATRPPRGLVLGAAAAALAGCATAGVFASLVALAEVLDRGLGLQLLSWVVLVVAHRLPLAIGVGGMSALVLAVVLAWAGSRRRAFGAVRAALEEAAAAAGRRVESLRVEAASQAVALARDRSLDPLDEDLLGACERELLAERERSDVRVRLGDELRDAEGHARDLETQRSEESARVAAARERLAGLAEAFAAWKVEAGIPVTLAVETAGDFLEEARRGRDALEERERLADERRRLAADGAAFRSEVDAVLVEAAAAGEPVTDDAQRIAALEALAARCAADRAARERREPLARRADELGKRFADVETSLGASRAELAALLQEAAAPDVQSLQRRLEQAARAAELEERVARGEAELERRLRAAGEEDADALREELPLGTVDAWEERAETARRQLGRVLAERDAVLREHQDRARDRARLEESTAVMDLELRKSAFEQELREVLDDWRRLRLAAGLVEEALRRFEEAHQPGVLREASGLFARVTGGRYPRIVQTDGRAGFAVLTADGAHRSPGQLSQGTAEQLYLCIRLGLVAEMARGGRALPVVMDDVLVNFDDARAAAMAEVLAAFASAHQILFFTCSARTRDLLASRAPNAELRAMEVAA